ncbi:tryptophan-rich sensory protein [Methanosarcina sp. KYL-1]|uniref:TspO/MBR family protein n=1 Tax=Methanosarcina sp. KYL-1 TaxID=2602068 RepID=UPI0021015B51|nr:TspO/MBR family protein [Methanosarcina sp. KYL-1]MCQ1534197.1 tryptophan-rich sensory protein [Methanosarcina sp. KYL-1]
MLREVNKFRLIVSILLCQLAGALGSLYTASSLEIWYAVLEKPAFNPPSWVFFPVWVTLYTLMGISLYLVWEKGLQQKEVKVGIVLFGIQLGLNTLWSFLFFGLRSPYYAFIEILFLWLAIFLTIVQFSRISKTASILLVPYILWVSFAALLNYQIWVLNP